MNILRYISILSVSSLLLTGCVDLDYTEVTTNNEDWVYSSPLYGIQPLVTSIYARIPNGFDKNYEEGEVAMVAAATEEPECHLPQQV